MKKMKWIILLLVVVMSLSVFTGCTVAKDSSSDAAQTSSDSAVTWTETVKVAALKGPTALGMVNMMKEYKDSKSNPYQFTIQTQPTDIAPMLNKGEVDIAAIPTNLAATLYNKSGKIQMLALNTLGVLYLLEQGNTIQTVADLKGKTIYSTGEGAVPEYALNYVLEQNGLTVGKDVQVVYKAAHDELAALMAIDKAAIAVLPQPFVSTVLAKNKEVRVALDLTKEWENANQATLTMGCVVVRKAFLDEHPEIVASFLTAYKVSAEKALSDIDGTAKLSGEFDIVGEAIAKQAIPNCNIVFIDGEEMKTKANSFFTVLSGANPQSVGGKVPDDGLYYIAK